MCHNLIGWKSKVLDKWIREIQESQWRGDMWHDEVSHLTCWKNNPVERGKERRERKRREKREEEKMREKLLPLSSFSEIRSSTFVRARGKVRPRGESFE